MAKIYFMREGLTGRVHPEAEKPLSWCIEKLGLQMRDWWADLETKFTVDKWLELSPYSRVRWVLIQLDETEANGNWKLGYYFSPLIKVEDVKKLIEQSGPHACHLKKIIRDVSSTTMARA
jgi:hypothetical protein